jgi:hypothetical protein
VHHQKHQGKKDIPLHHNKKKKKNRKNPTIYNNRHPPKGKKENKQTNKLQSKTETLAKSAASER